MLRPRTIASLAVFASVAVAGAAPTETFRVPAESMVPTLRVGQAITVDLGARTPRRGDIVVLHPPAGAASNAEQQCGHRPPSGAMCDRATTRQASERFLKRVVALGGDRVALRRCHLFRNGVVLAERYIARRHPGDLGCDFPRPIVVPRGSVFVLGDNRGESDDSRYWGPVRASAVLGTVRR